MRLKKGHNFKFVQPNPLLTSAWEFLPVLGPLQEGLRPLEPQVPGKLPTPPLASVCVVRIFHYSNVYRERHVKA